ncbi:MAG: CDP-diacylglycerol--glycerol-3-phosphate 3-phosphatidyltransferase [Alphaproteobacteria bacterium]|nr:CDP-diacylglycerol--glycerol-3-phosphate 3-phosphatidyltransferase [Alphaproteobacteria bacterium]
MSISYLKFIPNLLTILRIILVAPIWICLCMENKSMGHKLAFLLYLLSALTDFLDGYLSRKLKAESIFGQILDPLADKILVSSTLILLVYLHYANPVFASIIIAREIFVSGARESIARITNLKTDVMKVSFLAKIKTSVQFLALNTLILAGLELDFLDFIYIGNILLFVAAILSLYTAATYSMNIVHLLLRDSPTL